MPVIRQILWVAVTCVMMSDAEIYAQATSGSSAQGTADSARPRYLVPGNGYFTYQIPGRGTVTYYNPGPSYYTNTPGIASFGIAPAAGTTSSTPNARSVRQAPFYQNQTFWRGPFSPDWNPRYRRLDTSDDNGFYGYGFGP